MILQKILLKFCYGTSETKDVDSGTYAALKHIRGSQSQ